MTNHTRRDFLISAAAATAAAAAPSVLIPAARAIEPITRTTGAHFKFSLAAYSYRDLLTNKTNRFSIDTFIDDCARFSLDGTELTSYYLTQDGPLDYFRKLKATAFRLGLDVSGTAIRNDFCFPPGAERDKQIGHVKKWIEFADAMDAPVIRIFSGNTKPGQTLEQASKLAIAAIEECCEHAGKYGVFLALENHGGLTTKVDDMLAIIRGVKSPWFSVNLDSGNFRSANPYGDLAKIAPYAMNVQIKVKVHPEGKPAEESDFKRLAQILRDAGYRGYIVLEYEEAGDVREACHKYLDQIRAAFA